MSDAATTAEPAPTNNGKVAFSLGSDFTTAYFFRGDLAIPAGTVLTVQGSRPVRIEGYNSAEWVLLDYGDFVVHLFNGESREFYDLARLWRDARKVEIPEGL